ncbi:uncharacterized protein LOC108678931 [Hyalella azteca]|uniref:Uncharacterized protein LOC108678931 n=1 Tax=Hyalella azteca TaxID=294128 RepID=A0A8B7PA20_HYAAZ|nr:uncharacterized protein LOC108678931 [Hyalella azteca]
MKIFDIYLIFIPISAFYCTGSLVPRKRISLIPKNQQTEKDFGKVIKKDHVLLNDELVTHDPNRPEVLQLIWLQETTRNLSSSEEEAEDVPNSSVQASPGLEAGRKVHEKKPSPREEKENAVSDGIKHPLAETRFQFFLYDHEGRFVQKWITLQQIQDLLISHRVRFVSADDNEVPNDGTTATEPPSPMLVAGAAWDSAVIQRPDVNIDGVVNTVHKVMADEMANNGIVESTTTMDEGEIATLSTNIIQQLIREQFVQFLANNSIVTPSGNNPKNDSNANYFISNPSINDVFLDTSHYDSFDVNSLFNQSWLPVTDGTALENEITTHGVILENEITERENEAHDINLERSELIFDTDTEESPNSNGDVLEINTIFSVSNSTNDNINSDSIESMPLSTNFTSDNTDIMNQRFTIVTYSHPYSMASTTISANDLQGATEGKVFEATRSSGENYYEESTVSSFAQVSTQTLESTTTQRPESISLQAKEPNENGDLDVGVDDTGDSSSELIDNIEEGTNSHPNYLYDYDYDSPTVHFSNVLPPSQMATDAFEDGMDFKDDSENYDYYSQNIYLDDETQDYYEQQHHSNQYNASKMAMPSKLDFPGKDVAASYHPVEVPSDMTRPLGSRPSANSNISLASVVVTPVRDNFTSSGPDALSGQEMLTQLGVSVPPKSNILRQAPSGNLGLEETTKNLSPTIRQFINTMNDVSFDVYRHGAHLHRSRNFGLSPMNLISTLSMLLLGSRGNTSAVLGDLLRTDDFRNFNPHLLLKNIRAEIFKNNVNSNIVFSNHMFVELPRQNSVHSLDFFRQTIDYFYGATIEEADWSTVGAKARMRVNEAVVNQTDGRVLTLLDEDAKVDIRSPFSIVSSSLMQSPWSVPLLESDLFDMSFIRFPSAERRLVRTIGISKKMTVNAGYSREEDATIAEIPLSLLGGELSMILVLPGEQKNFVANGLKLIETRLTSERWSSLLRAVHPHTLTVQVPLFRHRAYTDVAPLLKLMNLQTIFEEKETDYSGVNSIKSLHLADVVQLTEFHSCLLENSSFSFRSVFLPLASTAEDPYDSSSNVTSRFQSRYSENLQVKDARVSQSDESIGQEKRGKNEPQSPSWRLLKDYPGFDYQEFKLGQRRHKKLEIADTFENEKSHKMNTEKRTNNDVLKKSGGMNVIGELTEGPLKYESLFDGAEGVQIKFEAKQESVNLKQKPRNLSSDQEHVKGSSVRNVWKNVSESRRAAQNPKRRKRPRNQKGPTVAFDRAFMYAIRHNPTGLILHIGRYLDPI